MLTFFATGKPYRGHDRIIQRNALKSWTLLHPDVEVIVFGDEDGAAAVASNTTCATNPTRAKNNVGGLKLRRIK